jgi:hypothetical protein
LVQAELEPETLPRTEPNWRAETDCNDSIDEPEAILPTFQFLADFIADPIERVRKHQSRSRASARADVVTTPLSFSSDHVLRK